MFADTTVIGLIQDSDESAYRQEVDQLIQWNVRTTWNLYRSRVRKRAAKISADPTHAAHKLFRILPSGGATECSLLKPASTERVFFPQAVSLMNTANNTMHAWTDVTLYSIVKSTVSIYTVQTKSLDTPSHSKSCLYFHDYEYCSFTLKASKL
ncbi:hypothetical protein ILYODFUR_038109 [Ilyodon furcidens]|uniref:Uncharacterized protein n=1 Tax=Ilyodon furcidens TaxID=33524 RepID=A0ABV0T3T7_9TELE